MKRQTQSEADRAAAERERLAHAEQPTLNPAANCQRCFGSGFEQVLVDGYVEARPCDHRPLPSIDKVPF